MRQHANVLSLAEKSKKVFQMVGVEESSIEVIEQVMHENTMKNFIDPDFPPCAHSLGPNYPTSSLVHFRRPHEYTKQPLTIFPEEGRSIEPKDVKVIGDNNNYRSMICAIATLAERPGLVERMF